MRNKQKPAKGMSDPCEKCGVPLEWSATKSTATGHIHYPRCPKPGRLPNGHNPQCYGTAGCPHESKPLPPHTGCGCKIQKNCDVGLDVIDLITFCPLHAAAPELLALTQALAVSADWRSCPYCSAESWMGTGHSNACLVGCAIRLIAAAERKA